MIEMGNANGQRVERRDVSNHADASSYDRGLAASMLRELRDAGVEVARPDDPYFVQGVHKAWSERRADSNKPNQGTFADPLIEAAYGPMRTDARPYPYSQVTPSVAGLPTTVPMSSQTLTHRAQTAPEFQHEAEEAGGVDEAIENHNRERRNAWKTGRNAGDVSAAMQQVAHQAPGVDDADEDADDDEVTASQDAHRVARAEAWKTGRNGSKVPRSGP